MNTDNKAVKIKLGDFKSPQMRAFHLSWFAFFLCFFGWFGIAPLMAVVRDELHLTKTQIGNTIIASVAITVVSRLAIGWLCDRVGPRRTYAGLLFLGALPVMGIGLANSYETFLLLRLAIGAIGGAFVITQYHTSVMFAANCVGTANATTAGWGNMGGGVTQMIMPLVLAGFVGMGVGQYWSWRLAMVIPGLAMMATGVAYLLLTQDTPEGNYPAAKPVHTKRDKPKISAVLGNQRVWLLFLAYAACFGVELTINNIAALYFHDKFELSLGTAGLIAGLFGCMNLFARTTGGALGDKAGVKWGLRGRVWFLRLVLAAEGIMLILFSQMNSLGLAIVVLVGFSLMVQMAEGATFSLVPFVDRKSLGFVTGIVGAGGNVGAVAAGFLFRSSYSTQEALFTLGICVGVIAVATLILRFDPTAERKALIEMNASLFKELGQRDRPEEKLLDERGRPTRVPIVALEKP